MTLRPTLQSFIDAKIRARFGNPEPPDFPKAETAEETEKSERKKRKTPKRAYFGSVNRSLLHDIVLPGEFQAYNNKITKGGEVTNNQGDLSQLSVRIARGSKFAAIYLEVTNQDGKTVTRMYYISRLMAYTFLERPARGSSYVIHKDSNIWNNQIDNLQWTSHDDRENIIGISKDFSLVQIYFSQYEAAKLFVGNIKAQTDISKVCNGKRKSAHGCYWRFLDQAEEARREFHGRECPDQLTKVVVDHLRSIIPDDEWLENNR